LIEEGRMKEYEDFEEVYFEYKAIIGEGFETKEQMVAEMR
jgi:hypothetical protein